MRHSITALLAPTGANVAVLVVALVSTLGTFLVFCGTTLVDEPATAVALAVIVVLSTLCDVLWKRSRDGRPATI